MVDIRLPNDKRLILEWVGRTLIVAGILILGFVGYQLWGTGLIESRAQGNLRSQFDARAKAAQASTTSTKPGTPATKPTATTTPIPTPTDGAIAVIKIPKIGLERTVVQGVTASDLREGPGHYPQTVMPGEIGNAAIAGHRTTYGAPFERLDDLEPEDKDTGKAGDIIIVRTLAGTYTYIVTEKKDVLPQETGVLAPLSDPILTLTTCTPKYTAQKRLIVTARLDPKVSAVARPPAPVAPPSQLPPDSALEGSGVPILGLLLSGLFLLGVGVGWWYLFHRRPDRKTWILGFVCFLVPLFIFYYFVERALPAQF